MSNVRPISTALNNSDPMQVLAAIIRDRMDAVHAVVGINRMYLIDSVNAGALYWLAKQFDVLGYKGWWQADTEEKKRALIRRAIELHRYKGTPWAVKEAIRSLGYTDVIIQERVGLNDGYYNGLFDYDASHTYGDSGIGEWATFRVIIGLDAFGGGISQQQLVELIAIINEYKNVRSHLVGISFTMVDEDDLLMDEETPSQYVLNDEDTLTGMTVSYDGASGYDGEYEYDYTGDTLEVVETPLVAGVLTFVTLDDDESVLFQFAEIVDIDWGDGVIETNQVGAVEHTYSSVGNYTIQITPVSDPLTYINAGSIDNGCSFADIINLPNTLAILKLQGIAFPFLDLSNLISVEQIVIHPNASGNEMLEDLTLPETLSLTNFDIKNYPLNTPEVDELWVHLDTVGALNGYARVNPLDLEPPSAVGLAAIASLESKGWTCDHS
jgi:phage tail P2-like protein